MLMDKSESGRKDIGPGAGVLWTEALLDVECSVMEYGVEVRLRGGTVGNASQNAAVRIILHHASDIAGTLRRTVHTVAGTPCPHAARQRTPLMHTVKPLAIPRHTPLVHRALHRRAASDPSSHPLARLAVHCARYSERHRKPERHHRKRHHCECYRESSARRQYRVSIFHPPERFDLTRRTTAVTTTTRATAASILRMISSRGHLLTHASLPSIHPPRAPCPRVRGNRTTPHAAGGEQATSSSLCRRVAIVPAPLASRTPIGDEQDIHANTAASEGRKDGSRASAESERRGISSASEGASQ
ncbi:hypothetical protein B0H14DRAFT_3862693 [Mycena olivaceomarginata]|nr:hypothetical protein B0H14DRAFT_3862693 [Mycena olivaceomarginata]